MNDSSVAVPRKEMNPATSVTVVRIIDDAVAGSWPTRVSIIGTRAPDIPAAIMDRTMATAMTSCGFGFKTKPAQAEKGEVQPGKHRRVRNAYSDSDPDQAFHSGIGVRKNVL